MTTPGIDDVGLQGTSRRLLLTRGKGYPKIIETCYTAIDVKSARKEESSFEKVFEIFANKLSFF
jgi:hypothetical protein